MSGFHDDRDELTAIQRYQGVPNSQHVPLEKGRWRRFLEAAMPWLKHKWELADAAADARLAQEVAKAEQMQAQAELTRVQTAQAALQTIAMARDLEQQKLKSGEMPPLAMEELEVEMAAIAEKIRTLGWKYGTQFNFQVASEVQNASSSAAPLPNAALEEAIAALWCEVLNVPAVGVNDNFFDSGGTSLTLARLQSRIAELGYHRSLMDFFRYPTISSFVAMLEEGTDGDVEVIGE
jgi:hypothetical protein